MKGRTNDESRRKRQAVARKYDELIGRNHYSQPLRDYCYRKHRDGNYYSDCSSSICYAYKEAGYGFGILNTAGIYQSARLVTVDVPIRDGQVQDIGQLRVGDMLEFAGRTRAGRRPSAMWRWCIRWTGRIPSSAGTEAAAHPIRTWYPTAPSARTRRHPPNAGTRDWCASGAICWMTCPEEPARKSGWQEETASGGFTWGYRPMCP